MSTQSAATSSMIILVVVLATTIGLFAYFMAKHSLQGYQDAAPRVAIPAPARSPGL